jgi:hypothetical protein
MVDLWLRFGIGVSAYFDRTSLPFCYDMDAPLTYAEVAERITLIVLWKHTFSIRQAFTLNFFTAKFGLPYVSLIIVYLWNGHD